MAKVPSWDMMRVARNLIKDELKRQGEDVRDYDAADITAAAKELVERELDFVRRQGK